MGPTFTIQNLVLVLVIVLAALLIAGMLSNGARLMVERGTVPPFFERPIFALIRWGTLILAALLILAVFSVPLSVIWGALAAGLALMAIGFIAVWSMLSNLSATLLIFLTRPFNIGDRIEFVGETTRGQVQMVGPMFTTLLDEEGHLIQVPNNVFFQKVLRRRKSRDGLAPHLQGPAPAEPYDRGTSPAEE